MLADNGDYRPSASEVKPINTPSTSEHKSFSERLRNKINQILGNREQLEQPAPETIRELAEQQIPEDRTPQSADFISPTEESDNNPEQPQEIPLITDIQSEKPPEPIIPDTTTEDQKEIARLRKAIQNLPTEEPSKPEDVINNQPTVIETKEDNTQVQPIDFYRNSLLSSEEAERIVIPPETLDLIEDPQQRAFYQNVSNLDNPELQKICFRETSYSSNIPDYFTETGEPNFYLLHKYIFTNRRQISVDKAPLVSSEQLSKLPATDQKKLKQHFTHLNYLIN